jgi:hypothetical protein
MGHFFYHVINEVNYPPITLLWAVASHEISHLNRSLGTAVEVGGNTLFVNKFLAPECAANDTK